MTPHHIVEIARLVNAVNLKIERRQDEYVQSRRWISRVSQVSQAEI